MAVIETLLLCSKSQFLRDHNARCSDKNERLPRFEIPPKQVKCAMYDEVPIPILEHPSIPTQIINRAFTFSSLRLNSP